jgi:hypothetical protein
MTAESQSANHVQSFVPPSPQKYIVYLDFGGCIPAGTPHPSFGLRLVAG